MTDLAALQDVRQTKEYAGFMERIGWQSEKIGSTYIYIKKLALLPFSIIKILRAKRWIKLNELKPLIRRYRPLFIKQQPAINNFQFSISNFQSIFNFQFDKHPVIPTKTIWVDLTKSEKQLLKEMRRKTRRAIRSNKHIKIKVISGDKTGEKDLKNFYHLWKKNKPFNFLFKPNFNELKYLVEAFKNKCFFVFAFQNRELISQTFILCSKNMAFDWFGASNAKARELSVKSLIIWRAIKEAKKRGLKVFDFEGIYDARFPRVQKGWQGFSFFKKGFGGEEVEFSQPLILLPGWA